MKLRRLFNQQLEKRVDRHTEVCIHSDGRRFGLGRMCDYLTYCLNTNYCPYKTPSYRRYDNIEVHNCLLRTSFMDRFYNYVLGLNSNK